MVQTIASNKEMKNNIAPLSYAPAHFEVVHGCSGGIHLAIGAQEAQKTHVAPFATHRSYALDHGTAEDSLTSP